MEQQENAVENQEDGLRNQVMETIARSVITNMQNARQVQRIHDKKVSDYSLYKDTLKLYGRNAQMVQTMEECGELIAALSHFMRDRPGAINSLIEEISDVEIMLDQLKILVGEEAVEDSKLFKQQLLAENVNKALRARKRDRLEKQARDRAQGVL